MKNISISFTILLLWSWFISTPVKAQGIAFLNDTIFENVLAKAKSENKVIFLDAYAVWCGPCNFMINNIFPQASVGEYHNENFINLKYDMEQPYGIKIKQKYNVVAYPTLLYIDGDGEVLHRTVGATPDAASFLEISRQAIDPERNFRGISTKIAKGDRTAATIQQYLKLFYGAPNTETLMNEHFKLVNESERFGADTWGLMKEYMNDIDSEAYHFFLANRIAYEERYSKKEVEEKLYNSFMAAYRKQPEIADRLAAIDPEIFQSSQREVKFRMAGSQFARDRSNRALWSDYLAKAGEYAEKNEVSSALLNSIARNVLTYHSNFNDRQALNKALEWSKKAIDQSPELLSAHNTYALLLHATGKRREAVTYHENTIARAKASGSNELDGLLTTLETLKKK